jgi:hypothetical protein
MERRDRSLCARQVSAEHARSVRPSRTFLGRPRHDAED